MVRMNALRLLDFRYAAPEFGLQGGWAPERRMSELDRPPAHARQNRIRFLAWQGSSSSSSSFIDGFPGERCECSLARG